MIDTKLVASDGFKPGKRIRVFYKKGGIERPFFWLRVVKEGHIYFGSVVDSPTGYIKRTEQIDLSPGQGKQTVDLGNYNDWKDADLKKGSRVSFKIDGRVHFGGEKHQSGVPLRSLRSRTSLAAFRFASPSYYKPQRDRKEDEYDIVIEEAETTREGPKMGILNVSPMRLPTGPERLFVFKTPEVPKRVAFLYPSLEKTPPLMLELMLYYTGIPDEWAEAPETIIMVWPD